MTDQHHEFSQLVLAGNDAASFLQGYVTADIDELAIHRGLPTAFTDIKGRVTASGWLWGEPTEIRILVHQSVAQALKADLAKYLMFAKSDWQSDEIPAFGRDGEIDAAANLPPTSFSVSAGSPTDSSAGHADFYSACVATGMLVVTDAIAGRFLPQSLGLTDIAAVSFSKGCYLGQEIVARAEHRGQVKIAFSRFTVADGPLATGTPLFVDDKNVGTVLASTTEVTLAATRHHGPQRTEDGTILEPC